MGDLNDGVNEGIGKIEDVLDKNVPSKYAQYKWYIFGGACVVAFVVLMSVFGGWDGGVGPIGMGE